MSARTSSGKPLQVSLTPERIAEKRAVREMIRGAGGLEAAELHCRTGKSQLARYYDETTDDHAPIDVIADLEPLGRSRAGWPHVTRLRARELGFALVPFPQTEGETCLDAHRALAIASKESGDIVSGLLDALASGSVSSKEARRLMPEALEAAEAFMRVYGQLKQVAEVC